MKTVMKWFRRVVYAVFVAFLLGVVFCLHLAYQILTPAGRPAVTAYDLKPGTSVRELAHDLRQRGLIRSSLAFYCLLRVSPKSRLLQAGVHRLSPSMDALQVLSELTKVVRAPSIRLTIPEGERLPEVAHRVQQKLRVPASSFLAYTIYPRTTFPSKRYLPDTNLEGYLFPDTYDFAPSSTAREIVERMLDRFEQVVLQMPEVRAGHFPGHLNFRQFVILASLVEAEAKVDADRPYIAGVYLNRLKIGMRLECDSTILYALKARRALTLLDLRLPSPYNTYLHAGLPPGPICNPGRKSFEAALHPRGDYLYYVRNDRKGDGSHVFARTYAQHEANIRKYAR